jgi:hypothetical protein
MTVLRTHERNKGQLIIVASMENVMHRWHSSNTTIVTLISATHKRVVQLANLEQIKA